MITKVISRLDHYKAAELSNTFTKLMKHAGALEVHGIVEVIISVGHIMTD